MVIWVSAIADTNSKDILTNLNLKYRRRDSNSYAHKGRGILSPLHLPITPLRHTCTSDRLRTCVGLARKFLRLLCLPFHHIGIICSGGRTRTDTGLPPLDPRSRASANFATPPYCYFTSLSVLPEDAYSRALSFPVRFIVANYFTNR